jgi:hypothetical protein
MRGADVAAVQRILRHSDPWQQRRTLGDKGRFGT